MLEDEKFAIHILNANVKIYEHIQFREGFSLVSFMLQ